MTATEDTRRVTLRHIAAWRAGDIAALMGDYAEDAVMMTRITGAIVGKAAIAATFRQIFATVLQPEQTHLECEAEIVSGEYALFHWQATTPSVQTTGAFDSLVIRNGMIVAQFGGGEFQPLRGD